MQLVHVAIYPKFKKNSMPKHQHNMQQKSSIQIWRLVAFEKELISGQLSLSLPAGE